LRLLIRRRFDRLARAAERELGQRKEITAQSVMPAPIGSGVPSKNTPATPMAEAAHGEVRVPISADAVPAISAMLFHGQHRRGRDDQAKEAVADEQQRRHHIEPVDARRHHREQHHHRRGIAGHRDAHHAAQPQNARPAVRSAGDMPMKATALIEKNTL